MLDVAKSLPEDPEDLRRFTALLLAEVKSQAMLIEKLRHQLAGHRSHRFGTSSETIEQLQLALEASEIATASMTAKLRLPDEEEKNKPKRRPIPDHIPRQEIELTTGDDDCARCGGTLRRLGEGEPSRRHAFETDGEHRGAGIRSGSLAIVLGPMADNGSTS
jgi:transposase